MMPGKSTLSEEAKDLGIEIAMVMGFTIVVVAIAAAISDEICSSK